MTMHPANKLVYYGRSLGGAVVIDLASIEKPAVLIEESAFSSLQFVEEAIK
jgi:PIN domain nuclease of toxin-antitoxin system